MAVIKEALLGTSMLRSLKEQRQMRSGYKQKELGESRRNGGKKEEMV